MSNRAKTQHTAVACPNCGTPLILDLCSKDWCPTCGQRFCCTDNACLDKIENDLWAAHQELLLRKLHHHDQAEKQKLRG